MSVAAYFWSATPTPLPSAWSRNCFARGRQRLQRLASIGAGLGAVGTIWIVAIMVLICADVVMRWLWSMPVPRVPEITGYSIVAITFLQLSGAVRNRRLTRADAIYERLERKRPVAAHVLTAVYDLSGLALMVIIVVGVWPELANAWIHDDYFGSRGSFAVAIWPFRAVVVACAAVAGIEFAVGAWQSIHDALVDDPAHPDARAGLRKGWGSMAAFALGLGALGLAVVTIESGVVIALVLIAALVLLILLGAPIAVTLAMLSFLGVWVLRQDIGTATNMMRIAATGAIQNQLFGVVPLFVLMGMLVSAARIGRDAFDVCQWALQRFLGGLGMATVAANAIFAAITGISIASAVVFTRVAVPPMLDHGYAPRFAVGIVAGSSVLGMLIPPSLLLIVYGLIAEVSVGTLFTAAIVPGLLLSMAFAGTIWGLCRFYPSFVGQLDAADTSAYPSAWARKPAHTETPATASRKLAPILALVAVVLGGIYGGIFSPTEAGAVGAAMAMILYGVRAMTIPDLASWRSFRKLLIDTGQVSVSILFLIIAANMYTRMVALSGLPAEMLDAAIGADLGLWPLLLLYLMALLVMGMILDSVSIMLITLPLILPIMTGFGVDLIWFGIVTVIAIEVGLLTPPLGLSVFVVKAALGPTAITLRDIFIGTSPFVATMIAMLAVLMFFPVLTEVIR